MSDKWDALRYITQILLNYVYINALYLNSTVEFYFN